MSVMRIKQKIVTPNWNPQKDLQSTTHSHRLTQPHSPFDFSLKFLRVQLTQSQIHDEKGKQGREQFSQNKDRGYSPQSTTAGLLTPAYFSTINSHSHQKNQKYLGKSIQTTAFDCRTSLEHSTPRSRSKSKSQHSIDRKVLNNLAETQTVESKFMISATPNQVLEESEIVFKGSRDVGKIMAMKLVYEQQTKKSLIQQLSTSPHQQTPLPIQFQLLKKSSPNLSLISLSSTTVVSLIKLQQSYILDYNSHPNLLKTYQKKKTSSSHTTYYFGEPYQYTLGELIKCRKIGEKSVKIVWKHLEPVVKKFCEEKCSFFQIEGIEDCIFYLHGIFKLLPIFRKGKVQTMKNYGRVKEEIVNYLLDLAYCYRE